MSRQVRRRDRTRQTGMTLVEVIVAMAVLSLVVLALGASLRGISRSAERVEERVDAVDELRVGAAFLRELFSRALVLQVPGPPRQLLFDAQAGSLAWVAVMPARFGAAGRYTFRLAAEPAADGTQALVLRYAPLGSARRCFPIGPPPNRACWRPRSISSSSGLAGRAWRVAGSRPGPTQTNCRCACA